VVPVCLMSWWKGWAGLGMVIEEVAGRSFESLEGFCEWLVGRRVVLGKDCTNAFGLFVGILERRKEEEDLMNL
jgi:hypothetical protein